MKKIILKSLLITFILLVFMSFHASKSHAESDSLYVDNIYETDTEVNGSDYMYSNHFTVKINGKTYESQSDYTDDFTIKIPKQKPGTIVTISSDNDTVRKVVQEIHAAKNLSYVGWDDSGTLSGTTSWSSRDWSIQAKVNNNLYLANIEDDGFTIDIPPLSDNQNVFLYTVSKDGKWSKPVLFTNGDTTTPAKPVVSLVGLGKTTITGKAEPYSTVICSPDDSEIDGDSVFQTQVDSSGSFKLYVDPITSPVLYFRTIDGNGNESTSVKVYSKDVTAPSTPTILTVHNTDPFIQGKGEKGAKVKVIVGTKTYTGTVQSNGTFKITIPRQKVGTIIKVNQTDKSNNFSSYRDVTVKKDTKAPSNPRVYTVYNNSTLLKGTTEPYAKMEAKIGKKVYKGSANASGSYSVKIPKQKMGTSIYVYAYDYGKNKSKATMVTVKNYLIQYFYSYTYSTDRFTVNKNVYMQDGSWKDDLIFSPYIKGSIKKSNLYFETGLYLDDWIFFDHIDIYADGKKHTIYFEYFKIDHNVDDDANVTESISFKGNTSLLNFLKKYVVNGKHVKVYFRGDTRYIGYELNQRQKDAIKQTLKYVGY